MSYKPEVSVEKKRIKVVIVGDGACGKTCLLYAFREGHFPDQYQYIPTVFENWVAEMNINNTDIELELWDTAGQEDYDRLRHLSYADAQAVIICFGIDSPDSLENVAEKWAPEVSLYAPGVPVVLAALKHDLRANEATIRELEKDGQRPTTPEMGEAMCRNIQAQKYIECSAKTVFRVREVFDATAKLAFAMQKKNDSKSCCIIL